MAGNRAPRMWRAYEFTGVPSRNRTLDSEVLGRNVGLPANDTRLEVFVDFEKATDARVRPKRYCQFFVPFDLRLRVVQGWGGFLKCVAGVFVSGGAHVFWKALFSFHV